MRKVILLLLLLIVPLQGAIFHEIDTTVILCCTFSSNQHNRILVDGGRIKKVIFPDDKLFVRMEEVSGQCFIQPKSPLVDSTLVSIVTQDGQIQDIEITFSDGPSEVIVLQAPCFDPEIIYELSDISCCFCDNSLNSQIDTLLKGEVPCGYRSIPFKKCIMEPKFGISVKLIAQLEGQSDDLLLYEVTNRSWWKKRITEQVIACSGVNWAYLEKKCLNSKETILGVVSIKNE